tara:strand:+ start:2361 stop:2522 length:162 start_codon:yes stop_codon:yes gene_type:complete
LIFGVGAMDAAMAKPLPVAKAERVGMIQLMVSPWSLRSDLKVSAYQSITESYE